MARHLHIETFIHADLDSVWRHTQDPALHQRWDLRFGSIDYLPRGDGEPQRFHYSLLGVSGVGVSAGERHRPDGTRTSVLRFGSEHPLSPIRSGAGYWRYVPQGGGVRFLTGYGYRPHVLPGRLMWWATAWSFDRLRLWLETGRTPERSLCHAFAELAVRAAVPAAAWLLVASIPAAGPLLALAISALAVLLPPLPGTPAARRCLRNPPTRRLPILEQPCPRSSSSRSATNSTAFTPGSSAASASVSTPARPA